MKATKHIHTNMKRIASAFHQTLQCSQRFEASPVLVIQNLVRPLLFGYSFNAGK